MLSIPNLKDIFSLILETNNPHEHTVELGVPIQLLFYVLHANSS